MLNHARPWDVFRSRNVYVPLRVDGDDSKCRQDKCWYNIISLFTNVPLDESIHILADEAFKDTWFNKIYNMSISKDDPIELLSVATKNQLFQFNGNLYEQVDGVAMASPLGPLMANAFMCSVEEKLARAKKALVHDLSDATCWYVLMKSNLHSLYDGRSNQRSIDFLSQECKNLKGIFLKLKYPEKLIDSAINRF